MPSIIRELHNKLTSKAISAKELASEYLARAKEKNPTLNALITISEEKALSQAEAIDEKIAKGENVPFLAGIPGTIKDVINTEGIQSTGASKILDGYIPPFSATVVKKLEAQGLVMIGKNNCDEFAMGGSNENSAFGTVKNPIDIERVPGGSSGGSAAAVAADMSVYSIGTDTGGSIRQPAAFTGTVGLKVTYGRVSRFGAMAMASSFDTIGPITKSVEDAAIILESIAGMDSNDSTTLHAPVEKYTSLLQNDIAGLRIGLPKEYFAEGLDPIIKEKVLAAVEILKKKGAIVKEVSLPLTKYAVALYYIVVPAEVSSNMARYDGIRFGPTISNPKDLEELYLENRYNGFGGEVKRRIMMGSYVLSHGYYDAYYKRAQQVRTKIITEFNDIFKEVDILATPVTPTLPYKFGEHSDPLSMYLEDVYTIPASAAGLPGLSMPVGYSENLPIGLQLLSPQLQEGRLLNVGWQLEQELGLF